MWKNKNGFTLVDSIIGLTILSTFIILFVQSNKIMNQKIKEHEVQVIKWRSKYEKSF
ncbi:type II secretion system protein [Lentilactobacillus laojiaonis]|uniref:type II secretion system protein n=1 Tax=Lentilactobacillus laojiaonis TaxID=2883998 RepID=UPI001D09E1D4|nr:type II secretion system protein [Lentilactobacillus laojiaonis]UDM31681.1 type II secretion system protein [Lentilactobacillus laojiaonis]